MQVLIIEDGPNIANKMERYILEYDKSVEVVGIISSVEEGLDYFAKNTPPNLIFSDIELNDGLCFDIFEKYPSTCPIIFTTSYNEYWQKAFKTNSIDYLLKPVTKKMIFDSIQQYYKFKDFYMEETENQKLIDFIETFKSDDKTNYKERFLLKMGSHYDLIIVKDIKYLFSKEKLSYVVTKEGLRFSSYDSLAKIEENLNPKKFFRINRKVIINIDYIHKVKPFHKGKLKVIMLDDYNEELVVSQTKSNNFRKWLNI